MTQSGRQLNFTMPEKPDEQIPRVEIKPLKTKVIGTSTPPPDFQEGGKEHRNSVLASSVLIVVLAFASEVNPLPSKAVVHRARISELRGAANGQKQTFFPTVR